MTSDQKIAPCLWYDGVAEEAAEYYVSVFPNSCIQYKARNPSDWPGGKAGDVIVVGFELSGQRYQALNGGPYTEFNEAVSLSVMCDDQAEVDRYWEALSADGGEAMQCGWLKDRYGLRWQIVPRVFFEMMTDADAARQKRVMDAMMDMVKFDVVALEKAYGAR